MATDVKPDLASRLDAVFGRLGGGAGGGAGWALSASAPFRGGKANLDDYSSDEDAERSAPAPLLGIGEEEGSDGEAGDGEAMLDNEAAQERRAMERFASTCSAHYRKAFEAEEEMDEFDRVAVGTWRLPGSKAGGAAAKVPAGWPSGLKVAAADAECKPEGSTQVLEDNPFDRMTQLRNPRGTVSELVPPELELDPQEPEALSPGSSGRSQASTQLLPTFQSAAGQLAAVGQPLPLRSALTSTRPTQPHVAATAATPAGRSLQRGAGPGPLGQGQQHGGRLSWAQRVMAEAKAAVEAQAALGAEGTAGASEGQGLDLPAGREGQEAAHRPADLQASEAVPLAKAGEPADGGEPAGPMHRTTQPLDGARSDEAMEDAGDSDRMAASQGHVGGKGDAEEEAMLYERMKAATLQHEQELRQYLAQRQQRQGQGRDSGGLGSLAQGQDEQGLSELQAGAHHDERKRRSSGKHVRFAEPLTLGEGGKQLAEHVGKLGFTGAGGGNTEAGSHRKPCQRGHRSGQQPQQMREEDMADAGVTAGSGAGGVTHQAKAGGNRWGGGAASQHRPGRRNACRLDWQQRGFVPDHVKNPERYTVYTLDEPLTVGAGEGFSMGQHGRQQQAAFSNGNARRPPLGGAVTSGRAGFGSAAEPRNDVAGQGQDLKGILGGGMDAPATTSDTTETPAPAAEAGPEPVGGVALQLGVGPGAMQFRRRDGNAGGAAKDGAGAAEAGVGGGQVKRKGVEHAWQGIDSVGAGAGPAGAFARGLALDDGMEEEEDTHMQGPVATLQGTAQGTVQGFTATVNPDAMVVEEGPGFGMQAGGVGAGSGTRAGRGSGGSGGGRRQFRVRRTDAEME